MKIKSAFYGSRDQKRGADVTDRLRSLQSVGGRLLVQASNSLVGDPAPNEEKQLIISAEIDGEPRQWYLPEHSWGLYPSSETRELGLFYTNNASPLWLLNHVMPQIAKAAAGKIDVLASAWHPLDACPFPQISSPYREASHLTIALQILSLLEIAAQVGSYTRVWFLEHDVLYPEGYFDAPPLRSENEVLANWNYRGLCATGWQFKMQNDEPLHQMAMDFSFARNHFRQVVVECLKRSDKVMLEPSTKIRRDTKLPAVHVNHGNHFTSHFNVYSKNTVAMLPYWGEWSTWWTR